MQKILIINLGGIGDLLFSSVAIKSLRELYKNSIFDILVVERIAEAAQELGLFDTVFIRHKGILNTARLLSRLRRRRYDLVVNMRTITDWIGAIKMFLLVKTINGSCSAGRNTDNRGFFFDIKVPETTMGNHHEMEYDIDTARALGAGICDRKIELNIDKHQEKMKQFLRNAGLTQEDVLIGVHPGGKPSHRWPVENFIKVIEWLDKKIQCKFIVTGDAQDKIIIEQIRRKTGVKIINLEERLSIGELGALISMCSLYIANDTGPMHIAAILNTPLVAIFGPGYINRFDPRSISNKAVVMYKRSGCAPCDKTSCKKTDCLRNISPEEVLEASLGLLRHKIRGVVERQ
ncbi:MAG: glycosyltransferase family 9 protein [Candidatus Omnitrophica bacterium]|nr:glycosyltransferase family 9 protein [Candidatus Omnitrophota bacterium]